MKKCSHRWHMFCHTGINASWRCNKCQAQFTRDFTPAEKKLWKLEWDEGWRRSGELHDAWRKAEKKLTFEGKTRGKKFYGVPMVSGYRQKLAPLPKTKSRFMRVGYALMTQLESMAEKGPKSISITVCDDRDFMGSRVAFIKHERKDYFMGATMLVVPQCNDEPCEVFLYPSHIDDLIDELKKLQKLARSKKEKTMTALEKKLWGMKPGKIDPEKIVE